MPIYDCIVLVWLLYSYNMANNHTQQAIKQHLRAPLKTTMLIHFERRNNFDNSLAFLNFIGRTTNLILMLKKIVIFLVALVGLLLVLAIFLPSSYKVERSATINAPAEKVYTQVVDLNNYLKWNPWSKMDMKAKHTISANSQGIGAVWSWDGQEVGKGSLTIEKVVENKSIETKVLFTSPRQDEGKGFWTFEETSGTTKVTWAMEGELGYPIGRFMGLMMDGMLGSNFEQGLANLKEITEK